MADGFYYPGNRIDPHWAKTSLLLFDRLYVLTPAEEIQPDRLLSRNRSGYRSDRHRELELLMDYGLVRPMVAHEVINPEVAERFLTILFDAITRYPDFYLNSPSPEKRYQIDRMKLGYDVEPALYSMMMTELEKHGVVERYSRPDFWLVSERLRSLFSVAHAAVIPVDLQKTTGNKVEPVTEYPDVQLGIRLFAQQQPSPSLRHVFDFDSSTIQLDVSHVPVDELIDFRHTFARLREDYLLDANEFLQNYHRVPARLHQALWRRRRQEMLDSLASAARELRPSDRKSVLRRGLYRMSIVAAALAIPLGGFEISDVLAGVAMLGDSIIESRENAGPAPSRVFSSYALLQEAELRLGSVR